METGINSPAIDTNIDNKIKNFPKFIEVIKKNYQYSDYVEGKINITQEIPFSIKDRVGFYADLKEVSSILKKWSQINWEEIKEDEIVEIFIRTYLVWKRDIKNKGTDKDTWNEKNGQ